jgi:hypothetical protein
LPCCGISSSTSRNGEPAVLEVRDEMMNCSGLTGERELSLPSSLTTSNRWCFEDGFKDESKDKVLCIDTRVEGFIVRVDIVVPSHPYLTIRLITCGLSELKVRGNNPLKRDVSSIVPQTLFCSFLSRFLQ